MRIKHAFEAVMNMGHCQKVLFLVLFFSAKPIFSNYSLKGNENGVFPQVARKFLDLDRYCSFSALRESEQAEIEQICARAPLSELKKGSTDFPNLFISPASVSDRFCFWIYDRDIDIYFPSFFETPVRVRSKTNNVLQAAEFQISFDYASGAFSDLKSGRFIFQESGYFFTSHIWICSPQVFELSRATSVSNVSIQLLRARFIPKRED